MLRRPPISTLFPTRRSSDLAGAGTARRSTRAPRRARRPSTASRRAPPRTRGAASRARSEEHTSELQTRLHLVCRLLLEKKKKDKKQPMCELYHPRTCVV